MVDATSSKQELFDYVLNALREQRVPSIHEDGSCAYRGTNNRRCAVGLLIPDAVYDPRMEGLRITWGVGISNENYVSNAVLDLGYSKPQFMLIQYMQSIHDAGSSDPQNFLEYLERNMKALAVEHNLIYTELTNA